MICISLSAHMASLKVRAELYSHFTGEKNKSQGHLVNSCLRKYFQGLTSPFMLLSLKFYPALWLHTHDVPVTRPVKHS